MPLTGVTITGIDETTDLDELRVLSTRYPFVEWGVLFTKPRAPYQTKPRFPGWDWIGRLEQAIAPPWAQLRVAFHCCGDAVGSLLRGERAAVYLPYNVYERLQLNFHGLRARAHPTEFPRLLAALSLGVRAGEVVFQIGSDLSRLHLETYLEYYSNAVILYDQSGGEGQPPPNGAWPRAAMMDDADTLARHGYAGGLGPRTLGWELPRIHDAAQGCDYWIDMETHVRTDDGIALDMGKVETCLRIAQEWIAHERAEE